MSRLHSDARAGDSRAADSRPSDARTGEQGAIPRIADAIERLASRCPWEPESDEELARAVAFLDWPVSAGAIQQAGDLVALLVAVAIGGIVAVAFGLGPIALVTGSGTGVWFALAVRYGPRMLATAKRTRALGEAPGLVSRAVLRMRLSPTPETAAAFAAASGQGRLAASLGGHVQRANRRGRSGLESFADEWAAWFPALRRALTLVESAGRAPPEERTRALDNALDVVLEGTHDTMAAFAGRVRGPATAIYAFGVLLPLALVAMLPAAGTIGVEVPLVAVVLAYDLGLPAALLVVSAWLLSRRPVAFSAARIPPDHPALPDRRWPALVVGVAAGLLAGIAATVYAATWAGALAGVGVGTGVTLIGYYRPVATVRERVRAIESGLADVLYLVGREVQRGRAVETAMDDAAQDVDGPAGEVLADATRLQRQLKLGVRESLLGEYGVLQTVPSDRARSTGELLALAATEGRPAGQAIVSMAEHLDDLQGVEREARRELRAVTSTLGNTAAVFGPLVGGATISLADRMTTTGPLAGSSTLDPGALGVAVGVYVLVLAVVLTTLRTGLERGLDRSLVGYRVGRTLASATTVFVVAMVASRALI